MHPTTVYRMQTDRDRDTGERARKRGTNQSDGRGGGPTAIRAEEKGDVCVRVPISRRACLPNNASERVKGGTTAPGDDGLCFIREARG